MSAATKALKPRVNNEWTVRGRLRRSRSSYLMMTPFMLLFTIFTIIPVAASMILSFTYFNMLQAPTFIGLQNYQRMFLDDPTFLLVLKNTFVFAIITGPLGYLISFVAAWLINELGPKLRSFMTLVYYAPTLTGSLFVMWSLIFSGDTHGFANSILMAVGIIREPVLWLSDTNTIMAVVIIVQLWCSMGAGFLSFIAGFQGLDKSYFEAAAIDGIKNRWQELFYVTLPQMAPQLMFSAVLQITSSFGNSMVITALAGQPTTQYSADTLVTYMQDIGITRFEMGYASAISVFLFAIMLLLNYVIKNVLRKYSVD